MAFGIFKDDGLRITLRRGGSEVRVEEGGVERNLGFSVFKSDECMNLTQSRVDAGAKTPIGEVKGSPSTGFSRFHPLRGR